MDKTDPPESFGVFKPVGHTVIAFRDAAQAQGATAALLALGVAGSALVRYSGPEMVAQVDAELPQASPLAGFGHELSLIKAHRALAEVGCSFLVVYTPDDSDAERVTEVARRFHAIVAQRYGRFVIEELIEPGRDDSEVFAALDRGGSDAAATLATAR